MPKKKTKKKGKKVVKKNVVKRKPVKKKKIVKKKTLKKKTKNISFIKIKFFIFYRTNTLDSCFYLFHAIFYVLLV